MFKLDWQHFAKLSLAFLDICSIPAYEQAGCCSDTTAMKGFISLIYWFSNMPCRVYLQDVIF